MLAFLGNMFGTKKAGEAIIGGVTNGIDKIWYTDEEKAEDKAQAKREGMAVYMKWLDATSGSRVARRLIALMVTGIWVLEHLMSVAFGAIAIFLENIEQIAKFTEASEMFAEHANNNNALVGVVLLFYFGGPAATDGVKGLVEKWANKGESK